jgi:bis(5'-nucleosyl)-tetraphosphatase (symmetrical)
MGKARSQTQGAPPSRIFIGDVQGCDHELELLLEQLRFDPAQHELWFVGDLVNRGPDSLAVLRRVRSAGARTVLGNHDLHLLGLADGSRRARADDTLDDVLQAPDREELLDWLRQQPLVQSWDDLIAVHAGLHPDWNDPDAVARPLEDEIRSGTVPWSDPSLSFLTRVRQCDSRGRRPEDARPPRGGFSPWDRFYRGKRTVVCGHWAQRGLFTKGRVRSLDTGCVWGGALSAWIATTDKVVSVPAARRYAAIG